MSIVYVGIINQFRKEKRLTVKEFCKLCKIKISTYNKLIKGDTNLVLMF